MRMRTRIPRWAATIGRLAIVAIAVAACSSFTPSADVTTTSPAWTNWFTFEWTTTEAEPEGGRRVSGYLYNRYGEEAFDVQLLTQALDRSGAVVGQRVTWAPRIPPLSSAFFDRVRNSSRAGSFRPC